MASSINSILGMGAGALYAHQNSIQTTGNNIANVDTPGYSRQGVRYETNPSLSGYPGQIGQGVRATEVYRMFNQFVEKAYINKLSDSSRWNEQFALLSNVDSLFYESDKVPGTADALDKFFKGWHTLSQNGALPSNREALLANGENLAAFVKEQESTLSYMQGQMDGLIEADVNRANQLIKEIAELNNQINASSVPGRNNPNALLDQRDLKARELSEIVDVDIIDKGAGNYTMTTKAGMTLVDSTVGYGFQFKGPEVTKLPATGSAYTGNVEFSGSDEQEYTVEVVTGGDMGDVPPPQFRVSLDGGKTWLQEAGADKLFTVQDVDGDGAMDPVKAKELEISFTSTTNFHAGDKFDVVPKSGVYWDSPTGGLINVTPQTRGDGTANPRRLTGGTLTAYFDFRDNLVGGYRDRLDTFARSVAWEVNRIHSQGVGLDKLSSLLGDYQVKNSKAPLGSDMSGLAFGDKLQAGNFSIALYDTTTGDPLFGAPGMQTMLDINFDPATDSLEDLVDNINSAAANAVPPPAAAGTRYLNASIVDGRLNLQANDPKVKFGMGADTSGVLAGLGLNTFFKGEGASDFAVRSDIVGNINLINAGSINGAGEGNKGDTDIALQLAQLASKKVSIKGPNGTTTEQTLTGYYASLVTKVGSDTQTAKYNAALYGAMAGDLRNQQDSTSGVNLDEEMTNLVKFQNSYKAAAKLITTADEMLQTVLGLKQ